MTIFGSDVSHYDATDTRAMFSEGIVFQTHKAGGDAPDGRHHALPRHALARTRARRTG